MIYLIFNIVGFVAFAAISLFSFILFIQTEKKQIARILIISLFVVIPGSFAWSCLTGIIYGEKYESETRAFLKMQLEGYKTTDIGVRSIFAARNAHGFELDSIDVDNIWQGKVQFNDEMLPYNLYEVNSVWRNRSEGKKEAVCFLYAWSNDIENGYRRHLKLFDNCNNRSEAIEVVNNIADKTIK